jgi:hypothetical protein
MPPKLTPEIIAAAIDGFQARKTRIDAQIAELRALLSGGPGGAHLSTLALGSFRRGSGLGEKAANVSTPAVAQPGD